MYKLFTVKANHGVFDMRDTNFGEDQIINFNSNSTRVMAVGISWALNLLKKSQNNKIRELREDIAYQRDKLYPILAH